MAEDERRAEIEAVARALAQDELGRESGWPAYRRQAATVLRNLDRLRDARGDDEAKKRRPRVPAPSGRPGSLTPPVARSPQGEDHETGIESICPECGGNGFPADYPNRTCRMCFGSGKVMEVRRGN